MQLVGSHRPNLFVDLLQSSPTGMLMSPSDAILCATIMLHMAALTLERRLSFVDSGAYLSLFATIAPQNGWTLMFRQP